MTSIKNVIRNLLRLSLACKTNERIGDAIDRHLTHMKRIFNKNKITESNIVNTLINMGIKNGDVLMVHASWRKFYNYEGSPVTFINSLLNLIGPDGTLLMPCYGNDKTYFDVNNTSSYAGVLSEVFRKMDGVKRSECSHFSVCAYGKYAEELTKYHKESEFGFDYYSPYFLVSQMKDAKIIKIGMGKYPLKLTLIHCVEYVYKDIFPYYRDYLSEKYKAIVINRDGVRNIRDMIQGEGGKLYMKNIKKVYNNLPVELCKYVKIGNIDIRIIYANAGYFEIVKLIESGQSMLNPPRANKHSFVRIKK